STVLTEIPGSGYFTFPDRATAVIVNPMLGNYTVRVVGAQGTAYSLSMATVDLFPNISVPGITESDFSGTIAPSGTVFPFTVSSPTLRARAGVLFGTDANLGNLIR